MKVRPAFKNSLFLTLFAAGCWMWFDANPAVAVAVARYHSCSCPTYNYSLP